MEKNYLNLAKNPYRDEKIRQEMVQTNTFSGVFEEVRRKNYNLYNEQYTKNGELDKKNALFIILTNYLQSVITEKVDMQQITAKSREIAKKMIEHLTGDYEIGVGNADFAELTAHAETVSSIIAYSNEDELMELLNIEQLDDFANGLIDGVVASDFITSETKKENAIVNFKLSNEKVKTFFKNSIYNIMNLNNKVANIIAHITKMDTQESKEFNNNIGGKFIGGILYDLISGTLVEKRHFTDVLNSKSMIEQIEKEGILHFSSLENINKIMESGKIRKSNFLESDCTRKKTFFFAGVPTFEDLLINIPAYDVMTAIKIKPTQEQMRQLKYRALNDRAVVKDGDFEINGSQAEIVHYGLMYDNEKKQIYLGELTQEEAKDFKVSKEVREAYHYIGKKSTLLEKIKMNAYGVFAEYKHHQKLLQMESVLKEKGINSFRDVNDETLVELSDIEQAYIDTKDKSVERKNLFETIKLGLTKNKEIIREEKGDNEIVHE